jgi:CRISPR-associated exonuclease Cas4
MSGENDFQGALFYDGTDRRRWMWSSTRKSGVKPKRRPGWSEMIASGITQKPLYEKKCDLCSLLDLCQPMAFQKKRSVRQYLDG